MNTYRRLVVKIKHGSHLYGLNTPESDTDYKAIVLPSQRDILLGNTDFIITSSTGDDRSKNGCDDIDYEVFSLQRFVNQSLKGEMVALDMLHSQDSDIVDSDAIHIWDRLKDNKENFYTTNLRAYVAYSQKQAAKYGVKGSRINALECAINVIESNIVKFGHGVKLKSIQSELPLNEFSKLFTDAKSDCEFYDIVGRKLQMTLSLNQAKFILSKIYINYGERARLAASNDGIDLKAISHALRAGYQARSIYINGTFSYPLKETSFLSQVKAGQLNYIKEVQPVLEKLVDKITILSMNSDLPEFTDRTKFDDMVMYHHKQIILS